MIVEIISTEVKVLACDGGHAVFTITEYENGCASARLRMTIGDSTANSPAVACADLDGAREYVAHWVDSMLSTGWAVV